MQIYQEETGANGNVTAKKEVDLRTCWWWQLPWMQTASRDAV